jgi:hypothetical protein
MEPFPSYFGTASGRDVNTIDASRLNFTSALELFQLQTTATATTRHFGHPSHKRWSLFLKGIDPSVAIIGILELPHHG